MPKRSRISSALLCPREPVLVDDLAVLEEDDPVGVGGNARIVRDDDHGAAPVVRGFAQQADDLVAGLRVQVAGRLVAQDQRRVGDHRPRQRNTLLLAAGKLRRAVLAAIGQTHTGQRLVGPLQGRCTRHAVQDERHGDVLPRREHGDQVEELEDEADARAAQRRERVVVQRAQVGVAKQTLPLVGRSSPPSKYSSVLLPEPLGPIIATNSPGSTLRLTPRSACTG